MLWGAVEGQRSLCLPRQGARGRGGLWETGWQEHTQTPTLGIQETQMAHASGGSELRDVVRNEAHHLARGEFMVHFLNNQNKAEHW